MVNTLKKIVLGALLASTVTVAFGAVNTFACDKADDPAEKWAEAREQMIENYKADLEEKIAEEKAAREAIQEEAEYKFTLQDGYKKNAAFAEFYVRAVAEQSRGLDRKAINQAKEVASEYMNYESFWYNLDNSFKNSKELRDWFNSMTDEEWEEFQKTMPKYPEDNWNAEADEKAWIATHPNGLAD